MKPLYIYVCLSNFIFKSYVFMFVSSITKTNKLCASGKNKISKVLPMPRQQRTFGTRDSKIKIKIESQIQRHIVSTIIK